MATINFPNSPSQGQEYSAGDMTWVYDSVAGWEVKQAVAGVQQVDGGAGLTGSVTSTGALDVGAGTGITVNPDDVEIDRTTVDAWYASAAQGALADTALQPGDGLGSFDDVTLTGPSNGQILSYNGSEWVNAAAPATGVTQVDGGAGLTGSVTTSGALDVGAGTGITVNADSIEVNRTVVDTWYAAASHNQAWSTITSTPTTLAGYGITDAATSAQGALADSALQPGDNISELTNDSNFIDQTTADGLYVPLDISTLPALP